MKHIKWNINQQVGFLATEDARRIYKEYYQELFKNHSNIESVHELDVDENGLAWLQMTTFMEIFGDKGAGMYFLTSCEVLLQVNEEQIKSYSGWTEYHTFEIDGFVLKGDTRHQAMKKLKDFLLTNLKASSLTVDIVTNLHFHVDSKKYAEILGELYNKEITYEVIKEYE